MTGRRRAGANFPPNRHGLKMGENKIKVRPLYLPREAKIKRSEIDDFVCHPFKYSTLSNISPKSDVVS